jgi:hypothetical protein
VQLTIVLPPCRSHPTAFTATGFFVHPHTCATRAFVTNFKRGLTCAHAILVVEFWSGKSQIQPFQLTRLCCTKLNTTTGPTALISPGWCGLHSGRCSPQKKKSSSVTKLSSLLMNALAAYSSTAGRCPPLPAYQATDFVLGEKQYCESARLHPHPIVRSYAQG